MAAINYGRVVLGGLVAGVVANIGDFVVNNMIMADDMIRMAQRLNLNQAVMASAAVGMTWVVVDFVYGTLIVWTYAAIRPRFGPGPGTAIKAGLVLWAAVAAVLFRFSVDGHLHAGLVPQERCALARDDDARVAGRSVGVQGD